MGTILSNQGGNVWTFAATGGSGTLPVLICQYDLVPKRVRWEPDSTTKAGDTVIIDDVQGRVVQKFVASGTYFEEMEARPREHEKWMGYYNPAVNYANSGYPPNTDITATPGVALKQLDSGTLYIYV